MSIEHLLDLLRYIYIYISAFQLYATSLVQLYDLVSPHVLILRTRKKTANVSGYILEIQNFRIKNV